MPEFSTLPALDINPVGFGAKNDLVRAQADAAQQETELNKFKLQREQAMLPLDIQEAKNKSYLDQQGTNNSLISQVVRDTMAADPDQRASIWDQGMRDAQGKGATAASQYVGRYREDLADNLADYYGGQAAGGPQRRNSVDAKADEVRQDAMDRQVAQMPPDQLALSLQKAQKVVNSFNSVHDQASWEQEMAYLKQNGIDPSSILPDTQYSPLNYAAVKRKISQDLAPYMNSMSRRQSILAIGATPPAAPPLGKSTYVGMDSNGRPVYHNPDTNMDTVGQVPITPGSGGKGRMSDFQFRVAAFKRNGMSDNEAIQAAQNSRRVPPERLRAIATQEAGKQLADLSLSGETIPNAQQWLKSKTDEIYGQLSASAEQPMPTPGGARQTGAGAPIPQKAADAVKAKGGQPVTFANGQQWVWRNGKPTRIK